MIADFLRDSENISHEHTHPKIAEAIEKMFCDPMLRMKFWAQFSLFIKYRDATNLHDIPTAGVALTDAGPQYFWNRQFIESLNLPEMLYVHMHELSHLLFRHHQREKNRDHKLSNITQDMVINSGIDAMLKDLMVPHNKVVFPEKSRAVHLLIPKSYHGEPIYEDLYEWMQQQQQDRKHGKTIPEDVARALDLAENYEFDLHIRNDMDNEYADVVMDGILEKLKNRGLIHGEIAAFLNKIRPHKKDYLKDIKRSISQIKGRHKHKTFRRPNRRDIKGIKGRDKEGDALNVVLDVSGSMNGLLETVLAYIFRDNIHMNLIQCDAAVQKVVGVNNKRHIQNMQITGMGGTVLMPALNYLREHHSNLNTVVLTDGYTDMLDFTGMGRKNLVITCGVQPSVVNAKIITIQK